jgi:hypothetical protein
MKIPIADDDFQKMNRRCLKDSKEQSALELSDDAADILPLVK